MTPSEHKALETKTRLMAAEALIIGWLAHSLHAHYAALPPDRRTVALKDIKRG